MRIVHFWILTGILLLGSLVASTFLTHNFVTPICYIITVATILSGIYFIRIFYKGLRLGAEGKNDEAVALFNKVIKLAPDFGEAYIQRGTSYIKKADYAKAILDCNKAIALNPKSSRAYSLRGIYYSTTRNFCLAVSDFDKAITLDPKQAITYQFRASVYFEMKDNDKAWNDVHEAEKWGYKPDKKDMEFLEKLKKASEPGADVPKSSAPEGGSLPLFRPIVRGKTGTHT